MLSQIIDEVGESIEPTESHRSSPAVLAAVNALVPLAKGTTLTCTDPDTWSSRGLVAEGQHQTADAEAEWVVSFAKSILARAPGQRIGVLSRVGLRRRFVDAAFADEEGIEVHRWEEGVLDTGTARRIKSVLASLDASAVLDAEDSIEFLRDFAEFHQTQDPADRAALADALGWVLQLLAQGLRPVEIAQRVRVGDHSTLLTQAGVHLLSGHAGKGQQFEWVVVVGSEDGNVPFIDAKGDEALLEEARGKGGQAQLIDQVEFG